MNANYQTHAPLGPKIAAAAAPIRRDARGRTCGGCRFNIDDVCTKAGNNALVAGSAFVEVRPLRIWRDDAVACGKWEKR